MKIRTASTITLAALLGTSAVIHLRKPEGYYSVVPPYLCSDAEAAKGRPWAIFTRRQWVIFSAIPEFAGAAGLLIPATRKAAATATAAMFVGFTLGHVSALQRAFGPKGSLQSKRIHSIRLPLQIPLVIWAWSARRA